MGRTRLSKIVPTARGEWNASTAYEYLDVVQRNGSSWLAKVGNTNVEPAEGDTWMLLAEKGEKGDQGIQGIQGVQGEKGDQGIQGVQGEKGDTGFSPSAKVEEIDNGARITVTDESGTTTTDVTIPAATFARFGVSGVGGSAAKLTRLWDSVGLTGPTPGTDTTPCSSAFDAFAPFNRKKCVGNWVLDTASASPKAKFIVNAYYGDADYTEDGSMGDYVAVEIEPFYYFESGDMLGVSEHQFPGWHIHPVCVDYDGNVRKKTYIPCYALALKDGKAVSLPGFHPQDGDYKGLWTNTQQYNNEDVQTLTMLTPSAVDHYEWLLFTIEYATQNCQNVMQGACNMRHASNLDDKVSAIPAANSLVFSGNRVSSYAVGQSVYLGTNIWSSGQLASMRNIAAIYSCDASGNADTSGSYTRIDYDGDDFSASITVGTTAVLSRPWITGATAGYAPNVKAVLGHTGSPVSNTDGLHPMRYRWIENVWGNVNMTSHDLANVRVDEGDSKYHLDWYYNADPRMVTTPYNYGVNDLVPSKGWEKLAEVTDADNYRNGYIRFMETDPVYPHIKIPMAMDGSSTTYYCDYAFLVDSYVVRAVRRRGYPSSGAYDGLCYFYAYYAPSNVVWIFGGELYFIH